MPKRRASQPDDDGDDHGADDDALDPDLPPEPPPLDPPFEWTIDGVTRTFTRASALSRSLGKQPGSGDELERAMAAFHPRPRSHARAPAARPCVTHATSTSQRDANCDDRHRGLSVDTALKAVWTPIDAKRPSDGAGMMPSCTATTMRPRVSSLSVNARNAAGTVNASTPPRPPLRECSASRKATRPAPARGRSTSREACRTSSDCPIQSKPLPHPEQSRRQLGQSPATSRRARRSSPACWI
mmetsp:Transcript_7264/g.19100  ORF Transcript_7264/g.19100 Transcript_7264/m.19100 type:complete len:242 (-) Transcript_7264:292-1017(-)